MSDKIKYRIKTSSELLREAKKKVARLRIAYRLSVAVAVISLAGLLIALIERM